MSIFKGLSVDEALEIYAQDRNKIKLLEITGGEERTLLIDMIARNPMLFLALDEKQLCTDIVVAFIKQCPTYFIELPSSSKNDAVRLAVIEKNPALIDLFDKEDITYPVVKYLYQNFPPYMLEDFDPEIQDVVDGLVEQLRSENVEVKYTTYDEIEEEEEDEE